MKLEMSQGVPVKSRIALGVVSLLCVNALCPAPANAVTYLYEINASYEGQPPGAANSVTGSLTMDSRIGPASINNIDIHATLPTGAGFFDFSFDQVINPVATWNAFGGLSPYLWFANSAFPAGDTHFFMGVKYDTTSNDGTYLIGMWGDPGNPHHSEISVPPYGWEIIGRMTREVAPVPLHSSWPLTILGFAGVGYMAHRRKLKLPLMAA